MIPTRSKSDLLDQRAREDLLDQREDRSRAWRIAACIPDPELPVMTIGELGILRDVTQDDQSRVHVTITATYSNCPAMETIRTEVIDALTMAGFLHVDVEFELSPPWTTDDLAPSGRAKLAAYGISPPRQRSGPQMLELGVRCPQCGSVRALEDDEVAGGHVLTCQSHPTSPVAVLDYDG